jgi:hypothetical protein
VGGPAFPQKLDTLFLNKPEWEPVSYERVTPVSYICWVGVDLDACLDELVARRLHREAPRVDYRPVGGGGGV